MNYRRSTVAIIEVKDNNPAAAIRELLGSMLRQGALSAVLVPQEIPSKRTVIPTLVRDYRQLEAVNPLAPVFSVNSAQFIAKMCIDQISGGFATPDASQPQQPEQKPSEPEQPADGQAQAVIEAQQQPDQVEEQSRSGPIGLVLRPCEIRALVELTKLQQATLEPFVIIGVDCWGTYSVQEYARRVQESSQDRSVTAEFLKQAAAGDLPAELRSACKLCQCPAPPCADVSIQLIGEDISQQIRVYAETEKGKALFAAIGLEETRPNEQRESAVAKVKEAKKQSAGQDLSDFLETIASLCINCRNCRAVCPICYCKQCVFDGEVFKYPLEKYLNWSDKKGFLGMPPDKLLFHLTRMSHVATSCVACGQCEAACPNGIPLGRIYHKISTAAQEALEYEAGRSRDEELPLTTFREDELSVVED
ncbi:MAG: 4Fe-4S dicluster domain-containing protein [Planctomycetota bacterium]|jgi:formate dehydrogenase subunit beta